MKILATNDDGIYAPGLWAIAKELQKVVELIVVAPYEEQSGVGTSLSLRQDIKVNKVKPQLEGIEAYSVEGTPVDCVTLAIRLLDIGMTISGINRGPNVGNDVFVSGTVGAALQAYLHGIPSLAISVNGYENLHFEVAAKLAALLATKVKQNVLPRELLLNVNLPNLPQEEIEGIEITTLSKQGYSDAVQQIQDGQYRITRAAELSDEHRGSDAWTLRGNRISITPLLFGRDGSSSNSLNHSLQALAPLIYQELCNY
jgi:5'-nucleotidase